MATVRSSTSSTIFLVLEGVPIGFLTAMEGDEPLVAEILETVDAQQVVRKRVVNVVAKPLRLTFGAAMNAPLYQWMTDFFNRLHPSKNGAIVFADAQMNEQRRIEFFAAVIVRAEIPAMSAASPSTGTFTLTLQAERVRTSIPITATKLPPFVARPKTWGTNNFRLTVQSLQTNAVGRIDAMAIEQSVAGPAGPSAAITFGPLRVPNLTFWLPEARAAEVLAWYNEFMIAGHHADADERGGSIQLLAPNLRDVLFTISLAHLGIVRIDRIRPTGEGTTQLAVQLYCEEMAFVAAA